MRAIWTPEPDGEYGEHHASIKGQDVMIYCDRDETYWECSIDGGTPMRLEAKTLSAAKREAEHIAIE